MKRHILVDNQIIFNSIETYKLEPKRVRGLQEEILTTHSLKTNLLIPSFSDAAPNRCIVIIASSLVMKSIKSSR